MSDTGQTVERRKIDILFNREQILTRVGELGQRITEDYAERSLVLVGALKGCFMFMADLARSISIPMQLEFISAASYRRGSRQDDTIAVGPTPKLAVTGRDVLLVEGVIDSGRTAEAILKRLALEEPKSLEIVTLLRKNKTELSRPIKYVGFDVANEFVVGYGLDYSQLYRNLNFIGHVREFEK